MPWLQYSPGTSFAYVRVAASVPGSAHQPPSEWLQAPRIFLSSLGFPQCRNPFTYHSPLLWCRMQLCQSWLPLWVTINGSYAVFKHPTTEFLVLLCFCTQYFLYLLRCLYLSTQVLAVLPWQFSLPSHWREMSGCVVLSCLSGLNQDKCFIPFDFSSSLLVNCWRFILLAAMIFEKDNGPL